MAYDGGDPARSASLHVAIVVGDVNDHSPRFDGDLFTVTVPEDFPLGVPFLQVICTWLATSPPAFFVRFTNSWSSKYFNCFRRFV